MGLLQGLDGLFAAYCGYLWASRSLASSLYHSTLLSGASCIVLLITCIKGH
jgi:hypothetical protein